MQLSHEEIKVIDASQFLLNSTAEELVLNISPGYLSEPNGMVSVLPIHTRIAMTPNSAVQLVQTLTQAIVRPKVKAGIKTTVNEWQVAYISAGGRQMGRKRNSCRPALTFPS